MASFNALKSSIFEREERKQQYQAHIRGLNAYDRHKKFVRDYVDFYGKNRDVQDVPDVLPVKTDQDTLREGYRFIPSEEDDMDSSWEKRLVKRYYDKLFKEIPIGELSGTLIGLSSTEFSSFLDLQKILFPIVRLEDIDWSLVGFLKQHLTGLNDKSSIGACENMLGKSGCGDSTRDDSTDDENGRSKERRVEEKPVYKKKEKNANGREKDKYNRKSDRLSVSSSTDEDDNSNERKKKGSLH
ncbi:hypothetical protein QJS10_CPA10g00196 [Acorus calamus]|uniref:Uncharacterized protein n=1 Tax=Acorus calamus TaxID=4465 RepID=A0AAV9DW82_ACOCL|nr:hypothetical protein QJS10_CPA10g00196 [Acorus calamus]